MFPPAQDHPWDRIFKEQGRFYPEPIPRFPEVVKAFQEAGCQRVLDLGCGSGRHTVQLARHSFRPVGMDISTHGLRLAAEWLWEEGQTASLLQSDFRRPLPFPTAFFDAVLSIQVVHHALAAESRTALAEIDRILAPGGLLFLSVGAKQPEGPDYEVIEERTVRPRNGAEAGLPHHYFTEMELRESFSSYAIREISIRAEGQVRVLLATKS